MKILIDARTLGKRPSGVGMYLYNFICGLMQYEELQIELLTDVTESPEIRKLSEAHIPIHSYGKLIEKSVGVYAYFRFVQKQIDKVRPDVFWEENNLIPVILKNPYGKIIVTVHDVFPITDPFAYGKVYQLYFRWNMRKTIKNVDAVIYNSKDTQQNVEKYYPLAQKRESYISYIITEEIPDNRIEDKGYFLYIGNLEERKGTDLLLKAYITYRKNGGQKELYLAGKMRSEQVKLLAEEAEKATQTVHYLGYIDKETKYQLYAGCSDFLFPSKAEGFGMPVIEALAYQKKVLVSDLAIFHEIAGDAVSYFENRKEESEQISCLADKMLKLEKSDKIESEKMKETVSRYSCEALSEGMRHFLVQLGK